MPAFDRKRIQATGVARRSRCRQAPNTRGRPAEHQNLSRFLRPWLPIPAQLIETENPSRGGVRNRSLLESITDDQGRILTTLNSGHGHIPPRAGANGRQPCVICEQIRVHEAHMEGLPRSGSHEYDSSVPLRKVRRTDSAITTHLRRERRPGSRSPCGGRDRAWARLHERGAERFERGEGAHGVTRIVSDNRRVRSCSRLLDRPGRLPGLPSATPRLPDFRENRRERENTGNTPVHCRRPILIEIQQRSITPSRSSAPTQ